MLKKSSGLPVVACVLALQALLGTFAWLTRHPETELVHQAQEWPLIGPLAKRFRRAYLPSTRPPAPESSSLEGQELAPAAEVEVVPISPQDDDVGARPYVWAPPGTPLYVEPDARSLVLDTVASLTNLAKLEQRGDWYRVRRARPGQSGLQGWVFLEDYREPDSDLLRRPDPVLPLPAAAPDAQRVAAARELMLAGGAAKTCGGHPLYTDLEDGDFPSLCARIVRELEDLYRSCYGLEPVGPPAEAILAFRRIEDYQTFRDREGVAVESSLAHASPARGYLALPVQSVDRAEVFSVLVHELTHLLNRRAIGPALPPWLSEGLAEALAISRIDGDGSLHPDALGGERRDAAGSVVRWGGLASIMLISDALDQDRLPTLRQLMRLDRQGFHRQGSSQLNYALSAFWVRYLVSGSELSPTAGFRAFLDEVAKGQPITEERFLTRLEKGWSELESGFRLWIRLQYIPPANETPQAAPRDSAHDVREVRGSSSRHRKSPSS